ncbi:hypothetical protein FACS1894102_5700 [Spirochaetia bacterium]|nr:hypothetical protein FACS1894102_5700 [Spirochaetia bacterium]
MKIFMKKIMCLSIVLILSASVTWAQENWSSIDMFGWNKYTDSSPTIRINADESGILVSGRASARGAGYVKESKKDIGFDGKRKIKFVISGVNNDKDNYDSSKLFKLELNGIPQTPTSPGMINGNDVSFVNARNGECIFDISKIREIRKINLFFFNCEMSNVRITIFVQ